ncbi:hypothetical protein HMPREF9069_00144 [Atopobium sp. oral taxon 810 str. F0209]|nr:hypothetical protein HMPREF9069_00144 [Atopobium sp. oral taxon 810 str. F0209]
MSIRVIVNMTFMVTPIFLTSSYMLFILNVKGLEGLWDKKFNWYTITLGTIPVIHQAVEELV